MSTAETQNTKKLSRKELLLLLLYAPDSSGNRGAPVKGRTRLTKMVFLLTEELLPKLDDASLIDEESLPSFEPWRFGPFSKDVFDDIDFFKTLDFISSSESGEPAAKEEALELERWRGPNTLDMDRGHDEPGYSEYSEEQFRISDLGCRYIEEKRVWKRLSDAQQEKIIEFKDQLCQAPLYAILQYVYNHYPKMAENSEIRDQL